MRQSAMSSLRARATIILVLRAPLTPSVRLRNHCARRAVLLEQQEAPSELDQAAAHPGVARFGETFLASLGPAFIRRTGEPGVACDGPAVTQIAREHFLHQHIRRFDADSTDAGQHPDHSVRPGLWRLLQTRQAGLFDGLDLLAY